MQANGLMHVYYGYGKGKTTAALGLALRAAGRGLKVVVVQFLKDNPCGAAQELEGISGVTVMCGQGCSKFFASMNDEDKAAAKAIHDENLSKAISIAESGQCDMIVLDEAMDAYQLGVLDEGLLKRAIFERPDGVELVVTGHKSIDWIIDAADYATEMVKVKHPFDDGVLARRGIEF